MKTITLFLGLILLTISSTAQHIEFPLDTNKVTVDGVLQASEWANAQTVMIGINTADNVQVMFKHDGTAMYLAYSGKLESANSLFPEVLTDAGNLGGNAWVSGQWWLHVSATDCENDGAYGVYTNCMATQPGWEGAPNFAPGPPMTDTVEIRIPFAKVGFNPATMDTMGISFMVTNTANIFRLYPTGADKDVPATWAKATFSKAFAGVDKYRLNRDICIYPNPVSNILYVKGAVAGSTLYLKDITGRVVGTKAVSGGNDMMQLSEYAPGVYIVEILYPDGGRYVYKLDKH